MSISKELLFLVQCVPRAGLFAVLVIASYIFIMENKGKKKEKIKAVVKQKWLFLFLLYLSLILVDAIFARSITDPYSDVLKNFGLYTENGINTELIINIIVFIPYAFFYLQAFRPENAFISTIILAAITTVFIECIQLVFWLGKFQISDIIHNILGGVIGYGIWFMIKKIKERREKN